jgi:hypothetical protein
MTEQHFATDYLLFQIFVQLPMPPVRVWDVGPDRLLFNCCS